MNVAWRKVFDQNYNKSLDHRSFYFKQVRWTAGRRLCPARGMHAAGRSRPLLQRACFTVSHATNTLHHHTPTHTTTHHHTHQRTHQRTHHHTHHHTPPHTTTHPVNLPTTRPTRRRS